MLCTLTNLGKPKGFPAEELKFYDPGLPAAAVKDLFNSVFKDEVHLCGIVTVLQWCRLSGSWHKSGTDSEARRVENRDVWYRYI